MSGPGSSDAAQRPFRTGIEESPGRAAIRYPGKRTACRVPAPAAGQTGEEADMSNNKLNGIIFLICGVLWIFLGFKQYTEKGSLPMALLFALVGISFGWNGIRYFLRDRR